MVDGLFDSIDIEPRVRFVDRFGVSRAANLAAIFFSSSRWANDLTRMAGVPPLEAGVVDALEMCELE